MATDIQIKSAQVLDEVLASSYYVSRLEALRARRKLTYEDLRTGQDKDLILFWHLFWECLPDSPSIRQPVFFKICDIAESIFDCEEPDDEVAF